MNGNGNGNSNGNGNRNQTAAHGAQICLGDILCAVDGQDIIGQDIEEVRRRFTRQITGPMAREPVEVMLMLARIISDPPLAHEKVPAGCSKHLDPVMGSFVTFQVSLSQDALHQVFGGKRVNRNRAKGGGSGGNGDSAGGGRG
eukprot:CAMPEP_0173063564 /NCGR_PEP_ID=MMETSP1102-20130122/4464_1 /TAXON_ID=49646 /ORGANISM="Geminigera sp., Strain Caron Lab Isolate" /LENGTH=142 /DNA_ID=CAMNT_0013930401 /DNA_START=45 /DNA_END=469 /DNA_ORIENTATION=-